MAAQVGHQSVWENQIIPQTLKSGHYHGPSTLNMCAIGITNCKTLRRRKLRDARRLNAGEGEGWKFVHNYYLGYQVECGGLYTATFIGI